MNTLAAEIGDLLAVATHADNPVENPPGRRGAKSRGHRRREARSIGRYPFVTCANRFLEETRSYYSESTLRAMRVGLKRLAKVVRVSPQAMTQADVLEFERWLVSGGFARGTKKVYRAYLKALLQFYGNGVYAEVRAKRLIKPENASREPLPCPSSERVSQILQSLRDAAERDDDALAVYGMAVMSAATGARLKEVLGAVTADVTERELFIAHPKGEERWASARRALILPHMRAHVRDYLDLRAKKPGASLIPMAYGNASGLRQRVNARLSVQWTCQEFRRAWGQTALDRGARIEAVSRGLGHRTTNTTETYYARIKTDRAFEELERVFQEESPNRLIESKASNAREHTRVRFQRRAGRHFNQAALRLRPFARPHFPRPVLGRGLPVGIAGAPRPWKWSRSDCGGSGIPHS